MRRILLASALAVLAFAAVAATALAATTTEFSVIAQTTSHHATPDHHFVIKGRLLQPGDRDDVVGHFKARFGPHHHIQAVASFPDGSIKVQGKGNRVPIIGGSGRWNGAAGKMVVHPRPHNNALLHFTVVQ